MNQRTIDCTSGTPRFTNWAQASNTCTCDPTQQQTQAVTCSTLMGPGYVGNVIQTNRFNCDPANGAVGWMGWQNNTNPATTCSLSAHSWAAGGSPGGVQSTDPNKPMVGDACTIGSSGYCEQLQGGGYVTYPAAPATRQRSA